MGKMRIFMNNNSEIGEAERMGIYHVEERASEDVWLCGTMDRECRSMTYAGSSAGIEEEADMIVEIGVYIEVSEIVKMKKLTVSRYGAGRMNTSILYIGEWMTRSLFMKIGELGVEMMIIIDCSWTHYEGSKFKNIGSDLMKVSDIIIITSDCLGNGKKLSGDGV
jgi:hypothetical protein